MGVLSTLFTRRALQWTMGSRTLVWASGPVSVCACAVFWWVLPNMELSAGRSAAKQPRHPAPICQAVQIKRQMYILFRPVSDDVRTCSPVAVTWWSFRGDHGGSPVSVCACAVFWWVLRQWVSHRACAVKAPVRFLLPTWPLRRSEGSGGAAATSG